ncbi:surface lipoprotein [Piscinibacter sakaiensis]|uniref:Surface lipoprotein n=1 Tax=Piscinibacter sakaiensis TaxID=1547922 RepID=A0A0K8NWP4_PISS1|nr:surface lipoprotein [Piscinibacter sakaiensis]
MGLLLGLSLAVAGCATTGRSAGQKLDPWENWNRKVFAFNEGLDEKVLKPVATVYSEVVPQLVRQGVANFFNNASDAWSAVNNFLQLKIEAGLVDVMRVGTNTVLGLGGVLDPASEMGMERHGEDFGQTLGYWGFGAGAYVVWPVFGPSTVRDSIALPLDRSVSPAVVIHDGGAVTGITLLQIVNTRANLLGASRVLDDIALDKYTFVRDAYLQRRRSLVFDGEEPDAGGDDGDKGAPAEAPARKGSGPRDAAPPAAKAAASAASR